jgi:gliding motility-associated-like protein
MKKTLLILLTACFFWLQGGYAQVVIEGEAISICLSPTVSVNVKATNFSDMVSAQFGVTWDPTVLQFSSVNNLLPSSAIYNTSNVAAGELKFSWFDLNPPAGFPHTNGASIFTLNFNVVGDFGDVTPISFGPLPGFIVELVNSGGVVPPGSYSLVAGGVSFVDSTPPGIAGCPSNISQTIPFGSSSGAVTWTPPTASDNCALKGLTSTHNPGASFPVGTTTVTYTAEDKAGNKTPCSFNVTLVQSPNPNPLMFSAGNDTLACNETQVSVAVTAKSFQNMLSAQFAMVWDKNILQYSSHTDKMNTLHPSVIYNTSGIANGEFRFSWYDLNASIGETLNDGDTLFVLHFNLIAPNATLATVGFSALPDFIIEMVSTSGDIPNGNIVFKNSAVLHAPDAAPVISGCPGNVSIGNDPGQCGAKVTWTAPTAADACDGSVVPAIITGPASGSLFPVGSTNVTYRATDSKGLFSECTFNITVTDTEKPVPVCPADITVNAALGVCTAVVTYPVAATDNCPGATILPGIASGSTFTLGVTNVTFIATDAVGNTATCVFKVTVKDAEAPVITSCPGDIVKDIDADSCNAAVMWVAPSVTDKCSNVVLTSNHTPGDRFHVDTTKVTYTATDAAGNIATCSFKVIVKDTLAPVLTDCPVDFAVMAGVDSCGAVVTWKMPEVTDNCTGTTITCIPPSGSVFPVGDSTVLCIAEDIGGNRDTCEFRVTVKDGQSPVLGCPADTTVKIPVGAAPVVVNNIQLLSQKDNCGIDTIYWQFSGVTTGQGNGNNASGTAFNLGVTTLTYTAEDAAGNSGNCAFSITVKEKLEITCPVNVLVMNDPDSCNAVVDTLTPTVEPVGNLLELFYEITGATTSNGLGDASGTTFNVGTSTVTYIAISIDNDTISCAFTVEVKDTLPPSFISCWGDTIAGNSPGDCGLVFDGLALPEAVDNCPGVSVIHNIPVGSLIPLGGPVVVTSTATDAAGNTATCTYNLTVKDDEAPVITGCPSDFAVLSEAGKCGASVTWTAPEATDNCQLIAFTPSIVPGTFVNVTVTGSYPIEYVAVDAAGNISKCQFKVKVVDNQPPVFQGCPGNISVNTGANACSAVVTWPLPVASDNCGVTGFSSSHVSGSTFQVGTDSVLYYASDAAGNESVCTFKVTVVDNQAPAITNVPADITVYAAASSCGATVNWQSPLFNDNCGLDSIGVSKASGSFFDVTSPGIPHEVVVTATDIHGNTAVKSFKVTVLDTILPELNCPDDILISIEDDQVVDPSGFLSSYQIVDCQFVKLNFAPLSATDVCGIASLTQTAGLSSGDDFPTGINELSFVAIDNHGNSTNCNFTVEIEAVPAAIADVSNPVPCDGSDVIFSVTEYANAAYIWIDPQGKPVSNAPSFSLNGITTDKSGTYKVLIALTFCDLEATVDVQVTANPQIEANANDLLCTDGSAPLVLSGNDVANSGVTDWVWEFLPTGSVYFSQTVSIPNATSANSGLYALTGITANGCIGHDTLSVNISDDITVKPALFGTSPAVCTSNEVVLNGQTFTGGSVSHHWYAEPFAGSGLIAINNNIVSVKPTEPGNYKYFYYVIVDGCYSDTAEWALNVEAPPVIEFSVDGKTTCVDGTSDLTLTETGGQATSWQWKRGNEILANTKELILQDVTAANSGNYVVIARTNNGCESTQVYTLVLTEQPDVTTELFASANQICKDATVTLTATPVQGATYIWTGPNLPPLAEYNSTITVQPGQTGSFEYTVAALVQGCKTDEAKVTVKVVTDALPAISAKLEGGACEDNDLRFCADLVTGAIYEWKNPSGNVFANVQCPVIPNAMLAMNGTYTVTALKDGCSATASLDISIPKPPVATDEVVVGLVDQKQSFNVIVNDSLYGRNYTISVVQQPVHGEVVYDGQGVFTYTPNEGFRETDRILYEICYEDCPEACDIALVTMLVRFDNNTCVVTSVITPNGDGINDELVVSCLELVDRPLNTLVVFNQWGDKVYEAAPYKNDWKGTYEGKDLPDGTYFYIFQADPDLPVQKGFVMIYR